MASRYAYIVSADIRYTPELCALLNSLDFVGNTFDVYVIGYKLEDSFKEQFSKLNYKVILQNVTDEEIQESRGLSEILCRKRYWYAAEFGKDYDSICVLDADMIFVRNPEQYFNIAAKTGYVLGASKEQNKVYNDSHHKFNGEWIIPEGYYNRVDLCNCPMFVDIKIWGEAFRKSWEWFITGVPDTNYKAPDMDAVNTALIKYGSEDKTIVMPGLMWLGTNEQLLKPYIRVINDKNLFKTECGIPIFSYHGQYYYKAWRDNQLGNRHHCAEGYLGYSFNTDNMARGAMEMLHNYFKRMLDYKIQIPKIHYRHPERVYEG